MTRSISQWSLVGLINRLPYAGGGLDYRQRKVRNSSSREHERSTGTGKPQDSSGTYQNVGN